LHRFSFQLVDNPSLPVAYVEAMSREFSGLLHRRLILGEWCLAEGVVYDMFDEKRHIIRGPLPQMVRIPGVGVDVGTVNPTAALMLGIQQADPVAGTPTRLVLMREYRFDSKKAMVQKTDAELSRDLLAWIGNDRPQWVAVDPSAASFKLQLWRDGMSNVMDANNAVLDGIRLMSSLLATNQLVIHESCKGLLAELAMYSWDSSAADRGDDKPLKVNDHSADAARYVIASTQTLWRPFVPSMLARAA
jgi:PBSX family phage terminase large subunit